MFVITAPLWFDVIRVIIGLVGLWLTGSNLIPMLNAAKNTPVGVAFPFPKKGIFKIILGCVLISLAAATGSYSYFCFPGL